ncbi:MAG: flotillin family protein [Deltaproteobacteria bacterium]|nr:flotillin family protein [Deltaproteobacteria bacterium]
MNQTYGGYPPGTYDGGGGLGHLMSSGFVMTLLIALGVVFGLLIVVGILKRFIYIARPNEALVFSGKRYTAEDGMELGYRVVSSGMRALRIPILEQVDKLDMRILPIDIVVQNAYSKGNIPLQIHAIANVKLHSDKVVIRNAIERFLGRSLIEVQTVAQQTLEGAVREVIATLTPEEVNEDRLKFAERLIEAAEDDLHVLGLQLDTLKIQNVADDTGYLDSLGRPAIANALRDAENAENQAKQETTRAQATSGQRAEVAKAIAETAILAQTNELRRIQATLDGDADAVEREAVAATKTARAMAERSLQDLRRQLEQQRLQAEVVIPADMQRQAVAVLAVGEAAPSAENGKAAVEVLRMMSEAWQSMGAQAKEIYVIQHLEEIVGTVVQNLASVEIDEVSILDHGDGQALAGYAAAYPSMVAAVLKSLANFTGIDVPTLLAGEDSTRALPGGVGR